MSSRSRVDFRRSPKSAYGLLSFGVGLAMFALFFVILPGINSFLLWLAAWSVTAFAFYGFDKMQAQRGSWRVPEIVLLALAAIGGAAGALLGMLVFRHKTQHTLFWVVGVVSLVVQIGLWVVGVGR